MKKKMTFLLLLPIALVAFWFASNSRAATETPEYKVVRADGKIEIRDYPALTMATTPMSADGMNGGFGQLFRFITGSNESKEKIEMTAPVLINNTTEKKTMSFIMPQAELRPWIGLTDILVLAMRQIQRVLTGTISTILPGLHRSCLGLVRWSIPTFLPP
jgi:hypothetical protein